MQRERTWQLYQKIWSSLHAILQKGTNEFLPASSKNLTKLLQKIDRFTVRLYIYTCTARSLILGLEMHICLLLQSSIWSKKCTRLQNRLAHIIYIYIKTHCQVVWNDCQEYNIQKTITAKEVLEIRNASASSSLESSLKVS